MTKLEFMRALEEQLLVLPYQERLDALEYYDEYFDDAGVDQEQQVIQQLGSPEAVAAKILGKSSSKQPSPPPSYTPHESQQRQGYRFPLWAILALSPIWLPLALGILVALLGFLIAIVSFAFAFVVMAIAFIFMTVVCFVVGVPTLITDPLNGLFVLGCGLASGGLGLFLLPLCGWMFKKCVPSFVKLLGKLTQSIGRMFTPPEAEKEW